MLKQILSDFLESRKVKEIDLTFRTGFQEAIEPEDRKFSLNDAGRCLRSRYFKRLHGDATSRDFEQEAGAVIRAWIHTAASFGGYLVDYDGFLEDAHREGRFDMLLEHDGKFVLMNVFPVSSHDMTRLDITGEPDAHHAAEIVTLYDALVHEQIGDPILDEGEDVDRLIIAYINRDNWQDIREFEVKKSRETVKNDWDKLRDAWEANTPPKPHPQEWECECCQFASMCD